MKTLSVKEKKEMRVSPAICEAPNNQKTKESPLSLVKYLVVGMAFGIIFVKAELISWFRIQEMFRLHSFHMYGIIGSAVVTGIISVWLIKRFNIRTINGEVVDIKPKEFNKGQIYGGLIFGLGWALTGACPGPIYAQIGSGYLAIGLTLFSAVLGTWTYGKFKEKFPH